MPAPAFEPSRAQRRLLDRLTTTATTRDTSETKYRTLLRACVDAGIPKSVLGRLLNINRKTVYSHLRDDQPS